MQGGGREGGRQPVGERYRKEENGGGVMKFMGVKRAGDSHTHTHTLHTAL